MGPKLCDVHGGMFHFKMQMYSTNYSYLEDIDSPQFEHAYYYAICTETKLTNI